MGAPLAGRGAGVAAAAGGTILLLLGYLAGLRARQGAGSYPDEYRVVAQTQRLRKCLGMALRLETLAFLAGALATPLTTEHPFLQGVAIGSALTAGIFILFDAIHHRYLPSQPPAWYDPAV